MPRVWYMFFIILISFVAIFLIFVMFDFHSQNHLIATDLQQAVTEDLQLTRDDSARMEKGVYAINEQKFIDNLEWNQNGNGSKPRIMIKDLNDTKESSTGHAPYDFIVRFLSDNNQTDNRLNNRAYNSNYQTDIHKVDKSINPIRGVQVVAIPYKDAKKVIPQGDVNDSGKKINDILNQLNTQNSILDKKKYVSSIILQEFDKDANKGVTNSGVKSVTASSSEFNKYLYGTPRHTHKENNSAREVDLTDND